VRLKPFKELSGKPPFGLLEIQDEVSEISKGIMFYYIRALQDVTFFVCLFITTHPGSVDNDILFSFN
jgi:hypothetical protein